ncbi:hypothetical protein Cgig2_031325 [Carnegiea gigantea]|uniref:Uncharacterized protein n=1 Tax=Carnegiea gigantea TaxID=171969 RepID=A0A9Q1QKE5_9CARY|nr:hypothetical protein Cgig2_031325 [Carnegiea gigantea]
MEEGSDLGTHLNYRFRSMSALEILRETVRILRFNCAGLVLIAAFLICPVSAVQMSNFLVDQSVVRRLAIRLLLIARTSGLPLTPVVKQSCQRFSEMAISSAVCFPLYATLLLLSKAAVVYSVDCTYSMKQFDVFKFFVYLAMVVGLVFSVVFAKAIIVSNIAVVISVLEDASGPQALLRSTVLIRGQTQVGLLMYLGSTMGMTFVQGLFEHRVKTLSYGDGSSRIWEGPLLVIMYSFVVLIDLMMTAVFYFSCWSFSMEAANQEAQSILEMATTTPTKGHSVPIETAAG